MKEIIDMGYAFMAFASGTSNNASAKKIYTGIGTAHILAVNPTREELNKIYNNNSNTEPIKYTNTREVDGKTINTVRISFILKLDPKLNMGIDSIIPINFNLEKRFRVNRDGSKVQVIDEYGRTTWVTKEQLNKHEVPIFSNGPARISSNYRPVLRGEENLVKFMKAFLNIPDIDVYNPGTGKFEESKDKSSCVIMFDRINDYFNGDIKEIVEGVHLQPDNMVKVLFGVRHTDDNKDYQDFFNGCFMRGRQNSTKMLKRELENAKNGGLYPNTEFEVDMIIPYEGPVATKFEEKTTSASVFDDDPFSSKSNQVDDLPFGF